MTCVEDDFWSDVLWGTTQCLGFVGTDLSKAEVSQLQIAILGDQQILWLQVTLDHVL